MEIDYSPADLAFRHEVRCFLDRALTPDLRAETERQAGVFADGPTGLRWLKILYQQGWAAPAWPAEYGGAGWSDVQRYIFEAECYDRGAPRLPAMGLRMCGPILMRYGTQAQKEYFLPRILSGEHYWCQGYSEPQAGSDLARLQCRAERTGDHYVVNGSKMWTTHAHHANWMFLLVRTSNEGKPQKGITFLLTPMSAKGISVRPLISMSGEHEVNQVFFDDVRIPLDLRVGQENQGWEVAKALLEFERGGVYAPQATALLRRVKAMALQAPDGEGGVLGKNRDFARQIAELEIRLCAIEWTERRILCGLAAGQSAGQFWPSVLKLRGTEILQDISELAVAVLGGDALPSQKAAMAGEEAPIGPAYALTTVAKYLNLRAASIYGGTSETQKNILARVALGL